MLKAALRVLFHVFYSATNSNVLRFVSSFYDRERMDRRSASFVEAKGHTIKKLKKQLQIAQQELQLKGKTLTSCYPYWLEVVKCSLSLIVILAPMSYCKVWDYES